MSKFGIATVQPLVQSSSRFSTAPMNAVASKKSSPGRSAAATAWPVVETLLESSSELMATASSPSTTVSQSKLTPSKAMPVPSWFSESPWMRRHFSLSCTTEL